MTHEIGAAGTGCGARRGIFVEFPGQHASREGFVIRAQREAVRHGAMIAENAPQLDHVHFDLPQCRAIAEGNHQIENARGNEFQL